MKQILTALALSATVVGCAANGEARRERAPADTAATAVGDRAPTASVVGESGQSVELATAWDGRPAVVIFYRGHW